MTSKAQKRHKNKHSRSSRPPTPASAGTFRMVAAANPGPSIDATTELELVKAALLYGDKVTILSPLTTMLLRTENLEYLTPRRLLDFAGRLAPFLFPPQDVPEFLRRLGQVELQLRANAMGGVGAGGVSRADILEGLAPIQQMLSEVVRGIAAEAEIDQLARARRMGLVQIENVDPGDELDLLVECIVAAKLFQDGLQQQDKPHTGRLAETFIARLQKHLSSGRDWLIFDRPIASLTDAAVREGIFTPAPGPKGRCAQAMTASGLMGLLPTFPGATVDEVLDIRSALAHSLIPFRGIMATISKDFTSKPWERDFEDEVFNAWVERVQPALQAIEASIRDDRSLLGLVADVTGVVKDAWSGLLIVGAGLLGHGDVFHALGGAGAIGAAAPVFQKLREREAGSSSIRMQPFYFLYRAETALG